MPVNPFISLFETPVATLTAAAYAVVLLAALVATLWALTRNYLWLEANYRAGWQLLPPLEYVLRTCGTLLIVAIDLLLIAGIIHTLS